MSQFNLVGEVHLPVTKNFEADSVQLINPFTVTKTAHGYSEGQILKVSGFLAPYDSLNGDRVVHVIDADNYSLDVDAGGFPPLDQAPPMKPVTEVGQFSANVDVSILLD